MGFKDRLVLLRKELGLTQEEFAEKIGYTRTAVSAWEIGRNEPSNSDTLKIADFFGVTTDFLLGKTDIRNYDKDEQDFKFAYHKDMEGLTDEEISDALRFYKEMKKRVEGDKK